ncbi:cell division protein FtsI (penicillin-binding protein 3) [Actinopolyspora biskrensis]|uniref:Cell division protein FtsI (Penicillin-binding protein 3) n=1 Tax=Actinopolyspora biskrensis TaxID=1470178 RepID=A0A852YWT9_9ACTN|nr:penicillin-binding protein 2 [Actinopolyspora biskrensis]NYH78019.1 cell division protein FtsI (penicillin-binding protein 3) [Actinopolyspora biskrensis]
MRPATGKSQGRSSSGSGGTRSARTPRTKVAASKRRLGIGRLLLVLALVATGTKLVIVQGFEARALSEQANDQLVTKQAIPAERGSITDVNGRVLAFSGEARKLYANPRLLDEQQRKEREKKPWAQTGPEKKRAIAKGIAEITHGRVREQQVLDALFSDQEFLYFGPLIDPGTARRIHEEYPQIGSEYRAVRRYPAGSVAANIVGAASWRKGESKIRGTVGLENALDKKLTGEDGVKISDTAMGSSLVIPGTKKIKAAEPGSDVRLTLDSDLQFVLNRKLASYVEARGASGGSAVVLDTKTGKVRALANADSSEPEDQSSRASRNLSNRAVTTPYEPGSVNKLITAAGAIEHDIVEPDTVLHVPDEIKMGGATIHDAWDHETLPLTFRGVLAKSSNVGTLKTARKLGKDRFADLIHKFGLGEKTGIALPGESPGTVPARKQWSDTRFANLPIGQGLSMTVLQMAGMYQAIANDGVRIPPRIVESTVRPDGTEVAQPRPEGVRVVGEQTADTVRNMLRSVVQEGTEQGGTAPEAALPGYQIAGKTGTAQKPDPSCGCYSNSKHWVTFAGTVPADDPRYVVGIMLDEPESTRSVGPLFHDVAADLTRRYDIPLSSEPAPRKTLQKR